MSTVRLEAVCDPIYNCLKGPRRNLRNDLLIAADSITNTMSSLVKELNSGENKSIKSYYFALWVFIHTAAGIKSLFSPQRVEVRLRALWIQTLDVVTYWPLQTPYSHINQGTYSFTAHRLLQLNLSNFFGCTNWFASQAHFRPRVLFSVIGAPAPQRRRASRTIWSSSWRTSSS